MPLVVPIDLMAAAVDDRCVQVEVQIQGLSAPVENQTHFAGLDDRGQGDFDILVLALGEGEN
ncbi:MAG: hypothetical protein BWY77_01141 [bacterium ADurb.Bin431]|nr:MAG: hypothetical protein BWY77_01141 [bacterium ADurb.Bin431]